MGDTTFPKWADLGPRQRQECLLGRRRDGKIDTARPAPFRQTPFLRTDLQQYAVPGQVLMERGPGQHLLNPSGGEGPLPVHLMETQRVDRPHDGKHPYKPPQGRAGHDSSRSRSGPVAIGKAPSAPPLGRQHATHLFVCRVTACGEPVAATGRRFASRHAQVA
jgi:hypothetical protein